MSTSTHDIEMGRIFKSLTQQRDAMLNRLPEIREKLMLMCENEALSSVAAKIGIHANSLVSILDGKTKPRYKTLCSMIRVIDGK